MPGNITSPTILLPKAGNAPAADSLTGTVTLHNANWKADYLANHVEIAKATLHLDRGEARWDSVDFSYGPVKGTASLTLPADCPPLLPCAPNFNIKFADLDASALEAAILGAHERGTLLSELIARLRPSTAPAWPELTGNVEADSLVLGPVTLRNASATLNIDSTGVKIGSLTADLLGGSLHGSGTLVKADQPAYTLDGQFEKLSPAAVCQLVALRCSGGEFTASGKIELSGFADKDLAASAKGDLHFEWRHGSVIGALQANAHSQAIAAREARSSRARPLRSLDRRRRDRQRRRSPSSKTKSSKAAASARVEAAITFGDPPAVNFAAPKETVAKRR